MFFISLNLFTVIDWKTGQLSYPISFQLSVIPIKEASKHHVFLMKQTGPSCVQSSLQLPVTTGDVYKA